MNWISFGLYQIDDHINLMHIQSKKSAPSRPPPRNFFTSYFDFYHKRSQQKRT